MKKVVSDRRASLDEDSEIKPAMRSLIQKEFEKGASVPLGCFLQTERQCKIHPSSFFS